MNEEQIDFHTLEVFKAVAEHCNFTGAGESLGLTQSAVSRRIQDLETSLGIELFRRTTRRVALTPAGEHWLKETKRLLNQRDTSCREFREIHGIETPTIRIGLGETIPFAHLPGILAGRNSAKLHITAGSDEGLIKALAGFEIDLAIASGCDDLPQGLEILHSYDDPFVLISPVEGDNPDFIGLNRKRETGRKIFQWVERNAPGSKVQIEVDSFDLAINLVSLGFGSALVPRRALAVYGKRKPVRRHDIQPTFCRTVIIAGRKSAQLPAHVTDFIESILFSESKPG